MRGSWPNSRIWTVSQELFQIDRNRFTCAGGTAAVDMMLALITRDYGHAIAALVTDMLIHHRIREAHEQQRMDLRARLGVSHPKLLSVVALMERTIEKPLSCEVLASTAKCRPGSWSACSGSTSAIRPPSITSSSAWSGRATSCARRACRSSPSPWPAATNPPPISRRATTSISAARPAPNAAGPPTAERTSPARPIPYSRRIRTPVSYAAVGSGG